MDKGEHLRNIISAVMNPCRIPPNRNQPLSFKNRPRTRISRSQVLAIGIMSFTMIAVLSTSHFYLLFGPIYFQNPAKYNTESVVVKFGENGIPVWKYRIPIANRTNKIVFEPGSISITECVDGGYAFASPIQCNRSESKYWGVCLCRLDDSGSILWSRIFDEINIELELSIAELQNRDLAIVGTSKTVRGDVWTRGVFVIRTDSEGEHPQVRNYPELQGVWGYSLVSCSIGDLALVGTTEIHSDVTSDVIIARINNDGILLWTETVGSSLNDEGRSILECDDGGFIVVGSTQKEVGNDDVFLIRTTSDGSIVWNVTHEDGGTSKGLSICALSDGRFAVTGLRKPSLYETAKALFLIVSSDGNIESCISLRYSSKLYAYGYYDICSGHAITQSHDGKLIIAGIVRHNRILDDWHMMILKTNASGKLLLNATYADCLWATACSVVTCEDQGYVIAGVIIQQA